ncbi:MAG TPA: hypothetical protein VLY24_01080 [Bryobacteraceae bacterium]|nr:hypothetical protein [Bryobacteraceae bacterium]
MDILRRAAGVVAKRGLMAAMYGGTILTPGIVSDEGLETYLKSVAHFKKEKQAKVAVEL